jgi:predicted Fe-S protein YdhL (DUF1289 family)
MLLKLKKIINRYYRRILRIIRYNKVLWESYDFDYRYATDLFRMKLEDIATFLESDKALSVDSKIYAQKIRTTIRLMDKVYNEEYSMEYLDELKELYGDNVNTIHFVPVDDNENCDGCSYVKREYQNWDNADEIKQKETELFLKSRLKQERAHRLLWTFIAHNIRNWWD